MPRCALFYQRRAMAERDPNQRMVLILPEHSQRPYRYGMTLLCIGAMFNWLGLADNNAEPVRYIGVTLIAAGAMLICLAMCFWMKATHDPQVAALQAEQDAMHIVTIHRGESTLEKPPDYDTVTGAAPPSYEDAIKLSPAQLAIDSSSSNGLDAVKVDSRPDPAGGGEGSSTECHVQVIATNSAKPSDSSSGDESTNPQADNFGSRVLRISRKFLGRSRSTQDVAQPVATESHTTAVAPDVSIR